MILLLLLLIALPLSAQISSGGGIVAIAPPAGQPSVQPTFWHKMPNGLGTTVTAFLGDDCINSNGTAWPSFGTNNFALDYDANDDLTACGTNYDALPNTAFTITAWVKADGYGEAGTGRILSKSSGTNSSWSFTISNTSAVNRLQIKCATNTSNSGDSFVGDTGHFDAYVGLTTLTFVAATCSCPTAMACAGDLFINGAQINDTQSNDATGTPVDDTAYTLNIGSLQGGGNTWDGSIDDVRIYPAILTAEQILWVYLGGHQ